MTISYEDYSKLCEVFRLPYDGYGTFRLSNEDRRRIYISLIASKAQLHINNPIGMARFELLEKTVEKIDNDAGL